MGPGVLQPGAVFAGDFRVIRPLSAGGMGAVYVVEQISTGRQRALKVMLGELLSNDDLRRRFAQEARIGAEIDSDYVVEVIAAGIDGASGLPWLAMELLVGEDFASYLARVGALSPGELLAVFEQVTHAIGAAHAKGIVHRDLKPENLFLARVRQREVAKVLDFGIAKLVGQQKTKATGAMGTPLWMAPEQTQSGAGITPAADVWALGLIAFRALSGRVFWRSASDTDSSPMMVLREVVIDDIPPASERARALAAPPLPAGFDAWFSRCVARDPALRFPNATDMFAALRATLSAFSPVAPSIVVPSSGAPESPFAGAPTVPAEASSGPLATGGGAGAVAEASSGVQAVSGAQSSGGVQAISGMQSTGGGHASFADPSAQARTELGAPRAALSGSAPNAYERSLATPPPRTPPPPQRRRLVGLAVAGLIAAGALVLGVRLARQRAVERRDGAADEKHRATHVARVPRAEDRAEREGSTADRNEPPPRPGEGAAERRPVGAERDHPDGREPVSGEHPKARAGTTLPDYPLDTIATVAESCGHAWALLATAPQSAGRDYPWKWTRQALAANPEFHVAATEPAAEWQVRFELHQLDASMSNAYALVATCADGATCNRLAAMYKSAVKSSAPQVGCGAMPPSFGPSIKVVDLLAGDASPSDLVERCARIGACAAREAPGKRDDEGAACQKAPATFHLECAARASCAEVSTCLGRHGD